MSEFTREAAEFSRLLGVVRELRERCPWDREQSLTGCGKYLIEEAYETTEAIERGDSHSVAEELGDLLSQVLFASLIVEQDGLGKIVDIVRNATDKLIRRHPHVYASSEARTSAEVVANWERIKRNERQASGSGSALDGIARNLPALMRAEKLGARARQAGMDWADIHAVLAKVREEMDEVEGALAEDDTDAAAAELGDMLLALANAPRFIGHNAEEALHRSCAKFRRRFAIVERLASERALDMTKLSEAAIDALWQEAKRLLPERAR
jgi:MazG family protein